MKKLSFLALSCVILFSACKKDSSDPGPSPTKARVMFTHTTISADSLRVELNNTQLASVPGLGFLTTTNYLDVDPGSTKVAFKLANAGNVVLDSTTTTFTANNWYSVFLTGVVNNSTIVITNDDLTPPPAGSAKVRLINLTPDNLNESFYLGPNRLDSNVTYEKATQFHTVTANTYTILVQDPSPSKAYLAKTISQPLAAGKIYTIMLYGTEFGSGTSALNLKVITNN